jgi:uncharacterized delta-60 repeat protein
MYQRRRFGYAYLGFCAIAWAIPFGLAHAAPHSAGDLDPTFGAGGIITTTLGTRAEAYALVLQGDGKLVAAGVGQGQFTAGFGLARYLPGGTLDTSFAGTGTLVTNLNGYEAQAQAVAVDAAGHVLAAGYTQTVATGQDAALVRYNAGGSLDPGFGSGGKVITNFGDGRDEVRALVLQADHKVVAGGYMDGPFVLTRYNPDGSLDSGFGHGGQVTIPMSGTAAINALALQADGKIVAAGYSSVGTTPVMALARLNPDGRLDSAFGSNGRVTTVFPNGDPVARAVGIQSDGKIVVAGSVFAPSTGQGGLALARYNPDGSLDPTFGTGAGSVVCFPVASVRPRPW